MAICLIALGSNLGDRVEILDRAVARLGQSPGIRILQRSRWRETSPVGGPPVQSRFLNGALLLESTLPPQSLALLLFSVEEEFGRQRLERWGPRTLDLDLLLYDQHVAQTPTLTIPHPRMAWRRFVLEPAVEVAGSMLHPPTGWTIARLLQHLENTPAYIALTGPIGAGKTHLAEGLARGASALGRRTDQPA